MTITVSARMKRNFPAYERNAPKPDVVQPQQINIFAQPVYVPDRADVVRPGADDHKRVGSRGLST